MRVRVSGTASGKEGAANGGAILAGGAAAKAAKAANLNIMIGEAGVVAEAGVEAPAEGCGSEAGLTIRRIL